MRRTAAPMVGGMITAPLLSLFVIPAIYLVWRRRELAQAAGGPQPESPAGLGALGSWGRRVRPVPGLLDWGHQTPSGRPACLAAPSLPGCGRWRSGRCSHHRPSSPAHHHGAVAGLAHLLPVLLALLGGHVVHQARSHHSRTVGGGGRWCARLGRWGRGSVRGRCYRAGEQKPERQGGGCCKASGVEYTVMADPPCPSGKRA